MANKVIPHDADRPQALHALVQKRAEIAGEAAQLRAQLSRLATQLDHVDATIGLFNLDLDISAIRPKPTRRRHVGYRGENTRTVFTTMREANGSPVTATDVLDRLMKERGTDPDDRELHGILRDRICAALRMHRKNGLIRHAGTVGIHQGWELVR